MAPLGEFLRNLLVSAISLTLCGMMIAWVWAARRLRAGRPLLPPGQDRDVPWGLKTVFLVFVTWVAVNVAIGSAYFHLTGGSRRSPELTHSEQMLVVAMINGTLLVLVPLLLQATSNARLADLGLGSGRVGRQFLIGALAFLLVAPVVYLVNGLAVLIWSPEKHPLEQMVRAAPSAQIAYLALISAVLLAPAAEEMIFRGIIQGWLSRLFSRALAKPALVVDERFGFEPSDIAVAPVERESRWRWLLRFPVPGIDLAAQPGLARALPIVLTSALFAVVHLPQWPAPLAIFVLSLGLGIVYQRTGSLVATFFTHALFNGFSTLVLFLAILTGAGSTPKTPGVAMSSAIIQDLLQEPLTINGRAGLMIKSKTFIQPYFPIGAGFDGCYSSSSLRNLRLGAGAHTDPCSPIVSLPVP
jgi:membrane protease YdiL (CAAX protease family)